MPRSVYVASCHKFPTSVYMRVLLSPDAGTVPFTWEIYFLFSGNGEVNQSVPHALVIFYAALILNNQFAFVANLRVSCPKLQCRKQTQWACYFEEKTNNIHCWEGKTQFPCVSPWLSHFPTFTTPLIPDMWVFKAHQTVFCHSTWGPYNLTQFWHYLVLAKDSTGWGLSLTRMPPPPDTNSKG